jgi:hypothetical protein
LREQLQRMAKAMDLMRLVSGRRSVLEAPSGLGYAPVAGR